MADEGYELMGPDAAPGAVPDAAANAAIPAFPVSSGGPPTQGPPTAGGIPQFPTATHGSAAAAPPSKQSSALDPDNKKAVSIKDDPSGVSQIDITKAKKLDTGKTKKSSMKNASEMEGSQKDSHYDRDAPEDESENLAASRPNSIDTCQLATVIFIVLIVVTISIPAVLTAIGKADIEFFKERLQYLPPKDL